MSIDGVEVVEIGSELYELLPSYIGATFVVARAWDGTFAVRSNSSTPVPGGGQVWRYARIYRPEPVTVELTATWCSKEGRLKSHKQPGVEFKNGTKFKVVATKVQP